MRLQTRVHEWLADHVSWIQYPDLRMEKRSGLSLLTRYQKMTRKERGWLFFVVFWSGIAVLSIYGNLID